MLASIFQWAVKAISHISSDQWATILDRVLESVTKASDGEARRAWVLDKIKALGVTGSIANFLVEAAVRYLKYKKLLP
jgi:inactivated superfamily I helicase